ncbi:MAG: hypothetical protein ACR2NP_04075 [Pirellulaceae bacterium]
MKYVSQLCLTLFLVASLAVMSGCGGDDAKKDDKKEGNNTGGATVQADNDTASTTATGEWRTVSLKLPKMT